MEVGMPPRMANKSAFTMVELLVVIAIMAILAVALTPALRGARESGDASRCQARMRNLHQAVMNYVAEKNGAFPYAETREFIDVYGRYKQQTGWVKWTVARREDLTKGVGRNVDLEDYYHGVGSDKPVATASDNVLCYSVWGDQGEDPAWDLVDGEDRKSTRLN